MLAAKSGFLPHAPSFPKTRHTGRHRILETWSASGARGPNVILNNAESGWQRPPRGHKKSFWEERGEREGGKETFFRQIVK